MRILPWAPRVERQLADPYLECALRASRIPTTCCCLGVWRRCIIVGSITGNTNTLAGNVPPKADLGDLSGLASRATMINGGEYDGAKAYKDSKVCNMLTMLQLHK